VRTKSALPEGMRRRRRVQSPSRMMFGGQVSTKCVVGMCFTARRSWWFGELGSRHTPRGARARNREPKQSDAERAGSDRLAGGSARVCFLARELLGKAGTVGSRIATEKKPMALEFSICEVRWERYQRVSENPHAREWLEFQAARGLAANTIEVYG
jgi:hypothetical protein